MVRKSVAAGEAEIRKKMAFKSLVVSNFMPPKVILHVSKPM